MTVHDAQGGVASPVWRPSSAMTQCASMLHAQSRNRTDFAPGHSLRLSITDSVLDKTWGVAVVMWCTCPSLACRQPGFCSLVMRNTSMTNINGLISATANPTDATFVKSVSRGMNLFSVTVRMGRRRVNADLEHYAGKH